SSCGSQVLASAVERFAIQLERLTIALEERVVTREIAVCQRELRLRLRQHLPRRLHLVPEHGLEAAERGDFGRQLLAGARQLPHLSRQGFIPLCQGAIAAFDPLVLLLELVVTLL